MNTTSTRHLPNDALARARDRRRLASLEVFLLFGLPVMSIAACAILAFVAYADGYTEIPSAPVASAATHAAATP